MERTKGYLISPIGKGIKYGTMMLNVTRLYNAATAVGFMRRVVALTRDYAARRKVFNKYSRRNKISGLKMI